MIGCSRGRVTCRKSCHSLAPSARAASTRSRGIAARPARKKTVWYPSPHQISMPAIAGSVSEVPPSHCGASW